ncbi:MAG: hypothetical protein MUF45_08120 [Spirosomaceae bacterium]|jgi:hypothetical protein|nr:hypothetical protein [Spirosomataceae bacterium]
MKKSILLIAGLATAQITAAQTIKPLPKEQHISPPSIEEFRKKDRQIPNLRYLKPQDLRVDTTSVAYASPDNMPILKVTGSMPNMYSSNQAYRMPRYLYDEKQQKAIK